MKVQITGWIHKCNEFDFEKLHWVDGYRMTTAEKSYEGVQGICKTTIEVEIPDDYNYNAAQVDALKEQARITQAKFAKDMMEIEDSISKLTCITNEVEA